LTNKRYGRDVDRAFGLAIRAYRKEQGLTQEALAEDCTLDRTYVSMLERGLRSPSLRTIRAISERLGVSMTELIARVETYLEGSK
jgi:transcriptional regulator with XRE-family HTH domain